MISESTIVSAYRLINPQSRVVSMFRYCHNSSRVKQRECIVCGFRTSTWCAEYPRTKLTQDEESKHVREHILKANRNNKLSHIDRILLSTEERSY